MRSGQSSKVAHVPEALPAEGSMLNKHQKRTAATKEKLLRAASRIFARDGFEASRIEEIAADAGYTRGAFYAHFKTKEDLFFALLEQQASSHLEKLRALLKECHTQDQKMCAVREYYAGHTSQHQWSVLTLEFKLYALRHPRLRAKLAASYRRIKSRMTLQDLDELFPTGLGWSAKSREEMRRVCEVLRSGIVLEHAYDSENFPEADASQTLRSVFDLLVKARSL